MCQWRSYFRFSARFKYHTWPVTTHLLCLYAQFLAYTFHTAKAVRAYIGGLRTLHSLLRFEPPSLKDIEVRLTLMSLAKQLNKPVKQAQPVDPQILLEFFTFLDMKKSTDLVFWSMLVIGFFAMLRKSNLMPNSRKNFDYTKLFTRAHVKFSGDIAILLVTWSKTLQYRNKILEIPLYPIPNSPLCPVTILKALLSFKGRRSDPLFKSRSGIMTYAQFNKKLKWVARKAGYKINTFSSHSLRRGGATWAYRSGVPENLIKLLGDWRSEAVRQYFEFSLEMRALCNLKMRERIVKEGF